MKNYIAINSYRNSTSNGFGNTWEVYECTKEEKKEILEKGLPVNDVWHQDGSPIYSTMGIRAVTEQERREYNYNTGSGNWPVTIFSENYTR